MDFFRGIVENPPLAGFLSHIHSDHLAGLDTYQTRPSVATSAFPRYLNDTCTDLLCSVYCSAATRAMLLKLQRRASRINFHQGFLEKAEITYARQDRRLVSLPADDEHKLELKRTPEIPAP